ncbi:16S rRNA (cytosine(1402)-N(4))-methyltransferase RsmH [Sutterella sp.]|uniref:16S rRNA (cytosine(1402)-N(4))-methyltransferase RsmH n=1 Tax=Sutterella sp. TaxID=1981025 RepID=UPI0026E0C09C|nr:16S rRNA (cytosine(1402)-N(4))-methyltransferase RsmH [Sutterella sp.]MDO5530843.1 16S rRNA (cytosine(1402)-N(4))-methyltransferase RsmH [Sutterella sp.]
MSVFVHLPVLRQEAPEALVARPDGLYVDGTFGRGGHSRLILGRLSPEGRLIAFDRDPEAIAASREITDPRFSIIHAPFSSMREKLAETGITQVDGVFLDIGVSSPQIDDPQRGFSFRFDGPLDMRMDTTTGETAAEWLARADAGEITRVLADYGEEKFARRIAQAIVERRKTAPLATTSELAKLVEATVPRNRRDAMQHPATRTFQAIRIEVNHELDELERALAAASAILAPAGRLAVISFHSLEDRIVKRFLDRAAHPERAIDPRLPMPAGFNAEPWFEAPRRILPSKEEAETNPRARSSVLRVAVRTARPWEDAPGEVR